MRVSLNLTDFTWPGGPSAIRAHLAAVVQAADAGGIDTVWVGDHLLQVTPGRSPDDAMLEAYTTLGYLAGLSERVRLGTMVTAATYRAPGLLIKAVTTLDVLSGGRAWLGLGSGYNEQEATALGLALPPVAERFARLEETLEVAHRMWSGDISPFHGAHLHLERPVNQPPAIATPHPPILVGGMGEQHTLRLVARFADACNLFDIPDGGKTITRKLAVLARHCEAAGRRYETVEKTVSTRLTDGEAFARRCEQLAALGIDHVVVIADRAWTPDAVATLARVGAQAAGRSTRASAS